MFETGYDLWFNENNPFFGGHMKVAVISDTHGLLRPEVMDLIKDADMILHGGDINRLDIIDTLKNIAPLIVVRGNNDKEWAESVPMYASFSLGSVRVYMTHKKKDLPEDLTPYDLIITGHTHKYEHKTIGEQVFLNPGSCGQRKPTQPITMAALHVQEDGFTVEKIDIPHPVAK